MEQNYLEIDGIRYKVSVPEGGIQRGVAILDGENAGRARAGNMTFDTIGTYYNYTITIARDNNNLADYDRMHAALRDPKIRRHIIKVPFAQGSVRFEAYVANLDDQLDRILDGKQYWSGLTVKFTATDPNETP